MKKTLIFAIVSILMLMISCSDDQPTKVSNYVFDKRNIENDTNWIEIFDIDTVFDICFHWEDVENGVICNSEDDYKHFYNISQERIKDLKQRLSQETRDKLGPCYKYNDYFSPNIDFEQRDLIIYSTHAGMSEFERKLYYNQVENEYFYLVTINYIVDELTIMKIFPEAITLPKLINNNKIKFDTIVNYATKR